MTGEDADRGDLGLGGLELGVVIEQEHVRLRQPIQCFDVSHDDALLMADRQRRRRIRGDRPGRGPRRNRCRGSPAPWGLRPARGPGPAVSEGRCDDPAGEFLPLEGGGLGTERVMRRSQGNAAQGRPRVSDPWRSVSTWKSPWSTREPACDRLLGALPAHARGAADHPLVDQAVPGNDPAIDSELLTG